ncbi:hypothetical protein [Actinopolyspora mortivallis]|nr:hypothetical protein [Actinopolyspora mortivallis]
MEWFGKALEGVGEVMENLGEEDTPTAELGDLVEDLGEALRGEE